MKTVQATSQKTIKPGDIWPYRITVGMMPAPGGKGVSGINTVIEAYGRVFDQFDMVIVPLSAAHDVSIVHAGMSGTGADIAMLHGLYFTAHYNAANSEWRSNQHIANSVRGSLCVTVPSPWVGETIRRDLRTHPVVIPHGVFYDEFQGSTAQRVPKTVFWGKNRVYQDVCDPTPLAEVARRMPDYKFLTTFAPEGAPGNIVPIGLAPHSEMKDVLSGCSVVLSTVPETWGILYAEAMACGTPVCTVDKGHVPTLVPHGVAGYTYRSGNVDDMARGIAWCEQNQQQLGKNGRALARELRWEVGVERIRLLCESILLKKQTGSNLYQETMSRRALTRA